MIYRFHPDGKIEKKNELDLTDISKLSLGTTDYVENSGGWWRVDLHDVSTSGTFWRPLSPSDTSLNILKAKLLLLKE